MSIGYYVACKRSLPPNPRVWLERVLDLSIEIRGERWGDLEVGGVCVSLVSQQQWARLSAHWPAALADPVAVLHFGGASGDDDLWEELAIHVLPTLADETGGTLYFEDGSVTHGDVERLPELPPADWIADEAYREARDFAYAHRPSTVDIAGLVRDPSKRAEIIIEKWCRRYSWDLAGTAPDDKREREVLGDALVSALPERASLAQAILSLSYHEGLLELCGVLPDQQFDHLEKLAKSRDVEPAADSDSSDV